MLAFVPSFPTNHRHLRQSASEAIICRSSAQSKTAILLVDHGSRRAAANDMLLEVADMVRGRARDANLPVPEVVTAHMELAEPTIADGIAECLAKNIVKIQVVPYFLAPGRHSTSDIPKLVEEAVEALGPRGLKLEISVKPPLGVHPKIGDVVLERAELTPEHSR